MDNVAVLGSFLPFFNFFFVFGIVIPSKIGFGPLGRVLKDCQEADFEAHSATCAAANKAIFGAPASGARMLAIFEATE